MLTLLLPSVFLLLFLEYGVFEEIFTCLVVARTDATKDATVRNYSQFCSFLLFHCRPLDIF